MRTFGQDAQIGTRELFFIMKMVFWVLTGLLAIAVLTATRPVSLGPGVGVAILRCGSWRSALRAWATTAAGRPWSSHNNPATLPGRLAEPSISTVREPAIGSTTCWPQIPPPRPRRCGGSPRREQMGTQGCLARTPHTPADVLEKLPATSSFRVIPPTFGSENLQTKKGERSR